MATSASDPLAQPAAAGERRRRIVKRLGFAPRAARTTALPPGMIYGVDDKPPITLLLFAGLQWVGYINVYLVYLLVLAVQGNVPPPTVAAMVGMSMIALGVSALLQALPRGPVGSGYLAPAVLTANYLGPSILAIKLGGLSLVFGMTIFAGCCEAALSLFLSRLKELFPIEVQGLILFLIGLAIGSVGFNYVFRIGTAAPPGVSHLVVAALTFAICVVLTMWGSNTLRVLALLIAMVAGYAASIACGLLSMQDFRAFGPVPLFAAPRLDHIGVDFDPGLIAPFAIAALASMARTLGVLTQTQKQNEAAWREPDMGMLRRGVLADGLATVFCGVVGTIGASTMPSAAVIPAATGMASRRVAYAIAAIFGVLAFLPLVSVSLALMPKPVIGAVTLFAGCLVMLSGLQAMTSCQMDQRRMVVLGLGLIAGLSADKYPQMALGMPVWVQSLTGSSLVLGTLVAVIANLLLVQVPFWVGTVARRNHQYESSLK